MTTDRLVPLVVSIFQAILQALNHEPPITDQSLTMLMAASEDIMATEIYKDFEAKLKEQLGEGMIVTRQKSGFPRKPP